MKLFRWKWPLPQTYLLQPTVLDKELNEANANKERSSCSVPCVIMDPENPPGWRSGPSPSGGSEHSVGGMSMMTMTELGQAAGNNSSPVLPR